MFWKWTCFVVLSSLWAVTFLPITKISITENGKEAKRYYNGPYGLLTLGCLGFAILIFTKLPIFPSIEKIGWRILAGFVIEMLVCGLFKVIDDALKKPKQKKS